MKRLAMFGAVLALAASAMAANLDQGTHELRLSGGADFNTGAGEEFSIEAGFGQFVVDNLEVGGFLGMFDNDAFTLWRAAAFTEYNFQLETSYLVPFVGGGLGFEAVDIDVFDSQEAAFLLFTGGAKFFVTEDLAIALQLNWELATEDVYLEDDSDISDNNVDVTLGLRYYWDSADFAP